MAKVTAPILSIAARGQIGKSQVYGNWRGVAYARQFVTPSNPRTTAQVLTRDVFSGLDQLAKRYGPLSRAPWLAAVDGRPRTDRNQVIASNLPQLREAADMLGYIGSPGARAGLPPAQVAAAPTVNPGEIEVTITSPAAPSGWMLSAAVAQAFLDRAPSAPHTDFPLELENIAPVVGGDTIVLLTGANSGVLYVVSAWLRWTRPDGRLAYGAALTTSATPA